MNIDTESQKNIQKVGKVAMSHTLLVFEVMNEKQTYLHINLKFISGPEIGHI